MKRTIAAILILTLTLLAGCAATGTHGDNLTPETAKLIRPGDSKSHVREVFGTPTRVSEHREGRETWSYLFTEVETPEGKRFPKIAPDSREEPAGTIMILFLGSGEVGYAKYLFGNQFRLR